MLRRSGRDDLVGQSTTTMSIIILIFVLCHMPRLGKLTTDSSTRFHLIRASTFPGILANNTFSLKKMYFMLSSEGDWVAETRVSSFWKCRGEKGF